jgi:CheY-like chemotaxis protein
MMIHPSHLTIIESSPELTAEPSASDLRQSQKSFATHVMSNQTLHPVSARTDGPLPKGRKSAAAPLTVMVVEDSSDVRLMIRILLEMEGYRVIEASDGLQAVEMAIRERPALIMMDLSLPRLDGLAATGRIRAELRNVQVVAISGYASPEHRLAAMAAGCADYLVKPLDFKHLDRILASLTC